MPDKEGLMKRLLGVMAGLIVALTGGGQAAVASDAASDIMANFSYYDTAVP